MAYKLFLVSDAEEDIFDIFNYVSDNDSETIANKLLSELEKVCGNLSKFPERGHIPPELESIGVFDFREIHYKPYRIIYRIIEKNVYIHCILDGRRNLGELLEHRLLR